MKQPIRYIKESSGVKTSIESFKKPKECDISSSSAKPLIQVKASGCPFRKVSAKMDKRVIERTYSAVRTSNYLKRSSVAPEKRDLLGSCVRIRLPVTAHLEINEEDNMDEKRRKSITLFENTCQQFDIDQENDELHNLIQSHPHLKELSLLKVIINGHFSEREMQVDISSIPMNWTMQQLSILLNDMYQTQFNLQFKRPSINVLTGRILRRRLPSQMKKFELINMARLGELGDEQIIILEEGA